MAGLREDSMPFKSEAQRRKFQAMLGRNEIDQETFDEWQEETGDRKLPERVGRKRLKLKKRKKKKLRLKRRD